MPKDAVRNVTRLLLAWGSGDEQALERLIPIVYDELRRLAHRYMLGERPDHLLNTTALVNEAYFRLVDLDSLSWKDRNHFFAIAAQQMRRILIDYARSRKALKRGGDAQPVPLEEGMLAESPASVDLLALDEALNHLKSFDPRKSRVVELRFFGGLTIEETASALDVSPDTVMRDWRFARSWLRRELAG